MAIDRIKTGAFRVTIEGLPLTFNKGDDFGASSQQDLKAGGDGAKLHGWYALNTGVTDAWDVHTSNPGDMTIDCDATQTIWWGAVRNGPFAYKLVSGNFDISVHLGGTYAPGASSFRFGKIVLAQSPSDLDDWVGSGVVVPAGYARARAINTVNGTSSFRDASYDQDMSTGYARLTRAGQVFTMYYKVNSTDAWTKLWEVARSDMPNQLRVGLMCSTVTTLNDVVVQFDELFFENTLEDQEVDVTEDVMSGSVTNVITNEIDSARVTLRDPDGLKGYASSIADRDILRVWTGKDPGSMVHRFTGPILGKPMNLDGGWRTLSISAQDYSTLLNNRQVAEIFEKTDSIGGLPHAIIKKLVDDHASDFTYNNVEDSAVVIDFIGWKYESLFQAIQQVAEFINWDWFVDVDKDIHFFDRKTQKLGFSLTTEMPDANIVRGTAAINPDSSRLENRVYVLGGKYLTASKFDQRIVGDGVATEFFLTYKPYYDQEALSTNGEVVNGDIIITYDYGGAFPTNKTVGIDGKARLKSVDPTDGTDVLVNAPEKRLIFDRAIFTPSSGKVIRAQFKHYVPIIEALDDIDSINAYGGEPVGLYEGVVVNEQIEDRRMARLIARQRLRKFAWPYYRGSCRVYTDEVEHGAVVPVKILELGINKDMLIRSITRSFSARGDYTISVALEEEVAF